MHRHRTDIVSLVFGLLFAASGTAMLARALPSVQPEVWRAWPVLLILLGLWVIVATARSRPASQTPAAHEAAGDRDADDLEVEGDEAAYGEGRHP